ncbi:hypothetical protein EGJ15_26325, partial [Pseudomonas sp. p99-361]
LTGAEDAPATLARNHSISHRYCTGLEADAIEVGAGLPAMGCKAAPNLGKSLQVFRLDRVARLHSQFFANVREHMVIELVR